MTDTTPDTPTCPRHHKRPAEPVLCTECAEKARDVIWKLPEQHRLLLGVRHATPTRTDRRTAGGPPPSPNQWFDHADDITRTLRWWAGNWAEHTGRGIRANAGPAESARILLDTRHGNPLETDCAPDLADAVLRLHHTAARLLIDEEPRKPTRTPVPGACPGCEHAALYRTPDSTLIRCGHCRGAMTEDEYKAYAHRLARLYSGAA